MHLVVILPLHMLTLMPAPAPCGPPSDITVELWVPLKKQSGLQTEMKGSSAPGSYAKLGCTSTTCWTTVSPRAPQRGCEKLVRPPVGMGVEKPKMKYPHLKENGSMQSPAAFP